MHGIPRLQHYVPQHLLKNFAAADGKLWAYDAEMKKMFRAGPKSLAAESFFYGPTTEHATAKSTAVENYLALAIDGPGAIAIDGLLARRKLSGPEIRGFFRFVAAQMYRTPSGLQQIADNHAPEFQETAERMAKFDKTFRTNVIAEVKAGGATEEELAQFIEILDKGLFTVTPTRDFTVTSAIQVIDVAAGALAEMKWTFLELYPSDGDLILCDHPVTLADVAGDHATAKPLGLKNPDIEIAMPLNARTVAMAHWDGPVAYGQLVPGTSNTLNERALRQIHRFAFAPFESKELLERTAALRGTGPKVRTRRIQVGEKLIIATELR